MGLSASTTGLEASRTGPAVTTMLRGGEVLQTFAMINQKGGCGKTTTAINTAAAFAEHRRRVLLVDLDPQGHATIGLGYDPDSFDHTAFDLLVSPVVEELGELRGGFPNLPVGRIDHPAQGGDGCQAHAAIFVSELVLGRHTCFCVGDFDQPLRGRRMPEMPERLDDADATCDTRFAGTIEPAEQGINDIVDQLFVCALLATFLETVGGKENLLAFA